MERQKDRMIDRKGETDRQTDRQRDKARARDLNNTKINKEKIILILDLPPVKDITVLESQYIIILHKAGACDCYHIG